MRLAVFLFLLTAQSAMALPIVCLSHEKTDENSNLKVKIHRKIPVQQNGKVWNMHLLGVTAREPRRKLLRLYSGGGVRPESLKMTIAKDGFVYGHVDADSPDKNGIYEGKIRIGGVLRGRVIEVSCFDEAIHGVIER